jgi:osmoprotectant transport system permease protein
MGLIEVLLTWLTAPARWQGSDGIPTRVSEHLILSVLAVLGAAVLALPLGMALGHLRKGGFLAMNVANVGRALPSMALLALALPLAFALNLGLGFWPTFLALVPLGLPPILTNTYVAVSEVDADVVDSARGMGMSEWQVLWRVELPLAAALIVDGIRNAAVAIVATATLGALVAGGGLGRYIVDGLQRQETPRILAGAVLVAMMAIVTEFGLGLVQRMVTPRGASRNIDEPGASVLTTRRGTVSV